MAARGSSDERLHKSQGARIRQINDRMDGVIDGQEKITEVLAQHDRDIRVLKKAMMDRMADGAV